MSCVVALEGFPLTQQFVIKELTIIFEGEDYQHFQFNCPTGLLFSPKDWGTIRYTQRFNGLALVDDSFLPYEVIGYILNQIKDLRIYTAGHQAKNCLQQYLPNTEVIDMCKHFGFKYPLVLQESNCFVTHCSRYCSLSKARTLKAALLIFQVC